MSTDQPERVTDSDNRPGAHLTDEDRETSDTPLIEHRSDADGASTEQRDVDPVEVDPQRPGVSDDAEGPPGASLFSTEAAENLRRQWDAAQTAFVDNPRAAVEGADHLVAETIQTLASSFTQERSRLEEQWARGESVSTEDLRVALQLYRSFFDRLLSI